MTILDRFIVLACGLSAASAGLAVHAAWPGLQDLRAKVEQRQEQELLERIAENTARFGRSLDVDRAADRRRDDPQEAEIRRAVSDFGHVVDRLRNRPGDRRSDALVLGDLEEVLRCRGSIDHFTQRHQLGADAEGLWRSLRADVDRLAPGPTFRRVAAQP
jgi:hypothetical protein